MIEVGSTWAVRDRIDTETCRRAHVEPEAVLVQVDELRPGKHNLDKGPTHSPPDTEVHFHFIESGRKTQCGMFAFQRAYVPWRADA